MAHMREDSPLPPPGGLKAIWKGPIHKALLMRLGQTLYLQNHFSKHSILLPMKVFLSLILPFLKEKKNLFFLVFPLTVEPCSRDIHLIWAPIYNGQFCLSQRKAHIFSLKIPWQIQATDTFRVLRHKFSHINFYQPRFMDTFYLCTVYD